MKNSIHIVKIVLLGALLIQLSSCTTSKSLMKDGYSYSDAGMHQEAVNSFKASLQRKYTNVEARKGLKTSGQEVLNLMLKDFDGADGSGNKREAVYAFIACSDFVASAKDFGVDLDIADNYQSRFSANKDVYVAGLYEDGSSLLDQEDFNGAKLRFDEIISLAPGYKDVAQLQGMSVLEPKYRRANRLMDDGYYREAYWQLRSIMDEDPSYRDVSSRATMALEYGQFVMAMLPFRNSTYEPFVEQRIEAYTLNSLVDMRNPFLKVVDRQNLDLILAEQNFSQSGNFNSASAVEVGKLTGADAILLGQVVDFRVAIGRRQRIEVPAFEKYEVTSRGDDGKEEKTTKYRPVTYFEYRNSNSVNVSFLMKMLDIETSEVLLSEVYERQYGDAVYWADYDGEHKDLVPDRDGEPHTNTTACNELQDLFGQRRELVVIDQVINDSYREIASTVAYRVDDFLR